MNRSLDFTACTRKDCVGCWRRLTKEEEKWLEENPNRQAYCDFKDCPDFLPKATEQEILRAEIIRAFGANH